MDVFQTRLAQVGEYRSMMKLVRNQTGKSGLTQISEIVALKRYGGQLGASDYFGYKLYDDSYLEGRGREDFLGWRLLEKFSQSLNPRYAVLPAWDKVVFAQIAAESGLPIAPVFACFHRAKSISRILGVHLKSTEEVADFLRNPAIYPLFGKPAFSQQGYGSAYLKQYDPQSDCVELLDGSSLELGNFLSRLTVSIDRRYHKPESGYLFQHPLKLAPEIAAFTRWPAICGVRIVCLNGLDGVTPIRAVWKIATFPNFVDNFSMGTHGNLVANVDLATGAVDKLIGGFWPNTEVLLAHPTTGHAVQGFKLPCWAKLLEICQLGGHVFPLMKIHHWDFALTDQGPLILELNDLGGTNIPQLHGHGLLTTETRGFLKRYANINSHPWIKNL